MGPKSYELDRQHMMALIQTDTELGEILTRAPGVGDILRVHLGSKSS
jgi:hypothetical protein